MSYFDILGINPTSDISDIKKAYAEVIKQHHPEDDPEGFQKVRRAYKEALAYANSLATYRSRNDDYIEADIPDNNTNNSEASGDSRESHAEPLTEQDWMKEADEDNLFRMLSVNNEISEKESIDSAFKDAEANYDFKELLDKKDDRKEAKITEVLGRFTEGYHRYSTFASYWKKFFRSEDFRNLMNDRDFTYRFTQLLYDNNNFRYGIYEGIFKPVLVEWSYYWAGTDLEIKLKVLSRKTLIPINRRPLPLIPPPLNPKPVPRKRPVLLIIVILLWSLIVWSRLIGSLSESGDKLRFDVNPGITDINDNQIIVTPVPSVDLLLKIMSKEAYDSSDATYQLYHIDQAEYDSLVEAYNKYGFQYLLDYIKSKADSAEGDN